MWPNDSSFWQYKVYADIRRGSLERGRQTTVGLLKKAIFGTFARYLIFRSWRGKDNIITPPPVGTGSGVLLGYRSISFFLSSFLCLFVCFFVSLSARLRENGWTDLHEIFMEGVE